jgi:hypothetical protein
MGAYVRVYVEAEDVLDDMSDEQLRRELERREAKKLAEKHGQKPIAREAMLHDLLEQVMREFRGRAAPEALRSYIYETTGRILP